MSTFEFQKNLSAISNSPLQPLPSLFNSNADFLRVFKVPLCNSLESDIIVHALSVLVKVRFPRSNAVLFVFCVCVFWCFRGLLLIALRLLISFYVCVCVVLRVVEFLVLCFGALFSVFGNGVALCERLKWLQLIIRKCSVFSWFVVDFVCDW